MGQHLLEVEHLTKNFGKFSARWAPLRREEVIVEKLRYEGRKEPKDYGKRRGRDGSSLPASRSWGIPLRQGGS